MPETLNYEDAPDFNEYTDGHAGFIEETDADLEADMLCPGDYAVDDPDESGFDGPEPGEHIDSIDPAPEPAELLELPERKVQTLATMPRTAVLIPADTVERDPEQRTVPGSVAYPERAEKDIPPEKLERWRHAHGAVRAEIAAKFPPDREGLDIARGDEFLRRLRIPVGQDIVELPESRRADLGAVVSRHPVSAMNPHYGSAGFYLPSIDTAFVFRDPQYEELNGAGFTEAVRIHELAHSAEEVEYGVVFDGTDYGFGPVRLGYAEQDLETGQLNNTFWQEARTGLISGKYIAEVLGKPHGFAGLTTDMANIRSPYGNLAVPSRYTYLDNDGDMVVAPASFAAAAAGHLIERDPALEPAFIAGGHDPEARKETIGRINAISPDLYTALGTYFSGDYGIFKRGLAYVQMRLDIDP